MNVNICVVPAFKSCDVFFKVRFFKTMSDKIFMKFNFDYNRACTNILQNY